MKVVPLRLHPGADLLRALETWMVEQQEQGGCVISAVGSLSVAQLRFAGAGEATTINGELEILSLSGTLSTDGAHHRRVGDRPVVGVAIQSGAGSGHRLLGAANQSSGSGLGGGNRRSTCRNTSQATPAVTPPVQSLRSSSMIEIVLAPMRSPRSRKRPSCSRRGASLIVITGS